MSAEGLTLARPGQHDGNPQFAEQHPEAVLDSQKAEIMAHASKIQEEQVVKYSAGAIEHSANIGNSDYAQDSAQRLAGMAEEARKRADSQAQAAGDVYDRVKKL